ncbi:probable flippase [Lentisphaera araneosa HTCC2155]|uniref:Probable flippase n=2 Tax=Lentisphaera TaxID=256846 RepID=A6DHF1_9BACT|nr:probable flippase [Lentisphaera araneosa HTCC2155]
MMLSLSELGLGAVMTHALYKPIAQKNEAKVKALMQYFAKVYKIIFVIFIVIGISIIPYLNFFIKDPPNINESFEQIYLLFLFTTAITYLFAHQSLFLMASQRQYIVTTVNYTVTIIQSCLQIFFLFQTKNYIHYLIIQVLGSVLQFFLIAYIVRKDTDHHTVEKYNLTKVDKSQIFRNVWQLSLGRISGFLVNGTDNIIIAKFIGVVSVGILSNYVLLIKTVENFILSLMGSISAGIGNFNAVSDKLSTSKLFNNICFIAFVCYGWISLAFFICSNDLILLLFGENYVMNNTICALLCLNFFMSGLINLVGTFMNSLGVFTKGRLVVIFTAIFNVVLSVLFGLSWGISGVLAATAVARLVTNWWYQPRVLFKYGFDKKPTTYFLNYSYFLIIIITSILIGTFLSSVIQFEFNLIHTLSKLLISSLVFFLCVYLIYRKNDEFKYMYDKTKQILESLIARKVS